MQFELLWSNDPDDLNQKVKEWLRVTHPANVTYEFGMEMGQSGMIYAVAIMYYPVAQPQQPAVFGGM